jgi:hypothetical protein
LPSAVFLIAGLLAGMVAAVRPASAASDSSDSNTSAVPAVCHSTGKGGGRLTWLPQRPDSAQAESPVIAAQHTTPFGLPRPLQMTQNQKPSLNPLSDPFGDKKTFTPAPAEKMTEELPLPGETKPKKDNSKDYLFEQEPTPQQHEFKQQCPSPKDLKKIGDLTTNIVPAAGELPHDCPLGNAVFQPRVFAPVTYTWTASGLCHKPLYFEDVQLERYGHMWGPWLQPFMSGAHFFLTVPILPYKMGLEPPNECIYTLGYYQPGSCAPYLIDPFPLSVRAALFEAGAWVGGVFFIP